MKYSQEKLNELAEKIDIVELIGQTEELHRKGQNYFCCCPFHKNDDTPSLCIYPETNKWYCFGCGAGSSVYDWICKKHNLSFIESVDRVKDITGSSINMYEESESVNLLRKLKKIKQVKDDKVQRETLDFQADYLDKFSDEIPEEWLAEDMTEEALRTYNIRIDHNANRIVYPVFDSNNNFIGVKGRTRVKAYKELGLSKYMNYQKINTVDYFQGWQQALPEIKNRKSVIIFEGIKSCIKAWGWGIRNTIAAETSKLSDGQLKLLIKNGFPVVNLAFDSDIKMSNIVRDPKIQMLKRFSNVYIITDTKGMLGAKMSPVDKGEAVFRELYRRKVKI